MKIVGPWEVAYGGGGDAYLNQLRQAAAPISDRVEFVGRVFDETKLIAHYSTAKIFVYPSLAEKGETFGLSVLEAMAAGCCPLVSALSCFLDFIRPGVNGQVFDHRAPDPAGELAAVLRTAIHQPVVTDQLRQAAWRDARSYTTDAVATRFLDDFASLTVSPGRAATTSVKASLSAP